MEAPPATGAREAPSAGAREAGTREVGARETARETAMEAPPATGAREAPREAAMEAPSAAGDRETAMEAPPAVGAREGGEGQAGTPQWLTQLAVWESPPKWPGLRKHDICILCMTRSAYSLSMCSWYDIGCVCMSAHMYVCMDGWMLYVYV